MTKKRIKSISLDIAEPGMVMAREVRNAEGQVLLQSETVLSEASISALHRRNINHIFVFHEDERSEEDLLDERNRVTERINRLFRNVPQDGMMGALREMILEYRLETLS